MINRQFVIRAFDIILSLAMLVCFFPLLIFGCLLSVLQTGSPIFRQKRVGKNGVSFVLYKIRTMVVGTADCLTHLANHESLIFGGSILRNLKIDELPQLVNILIGDMSLVGPRPGIPSDTELVSERMRRGVLNIRPGLTGFAQLYGVDMRDPKRLARFDSLGIKLFSLRAYFTVLVATAIYVVTRRKCGFLFARYPRLPA